MENYQGDLADIVRAGAGATTGSVASNVTQDEVSSDTDWQFLSNQTDYSSGAKEQLDEFGDPFSNTRDPLLQELDMAAASSFFHSSYTSTDIIISSNVENMVGFEGSGGRASSSIPIPKIAAEETRRPSNSIFSRMLQISPNAKSSASPSVSPCDSSALAAASPRELIKSPPILTGNEMSNTVNSSKCSLVENGGVQIPSPRNTGIKRRKSQAKKVVCIPAPAPASSRPSGEVVPSDLWAWRKYGQKPIKGSPYPRGYYRCSSSKGCSARKQVERSRTDPNMLVITYTSEHNHPWPTQRNALAGSTRSQPSKSGSASKSTATGYQTQISTPNLNEEQKESLIDNNISSSPIVTTAGSSASTGPSVKEEMEDPEKPIEMDDVEFREDFQHSCSSCLPESNRSEDFFAELGELEADPLNLLFTQGYSGEKGRGNKAALEDPFGFYDWTGNNGYGSSNNNYPIQESNKGS